MPNYRSLANARYGSTDGFRLLVRGPKSSVESRPRRRYTMRTFMAAAALALFGGVCVAACAGSETGGVNDSQENPEIDVTRAAAQPAPCGQLEGPCCVAGETHFCFQGTCKYVHECTFPGGCRTGYFCR